MLIEERLAPIHSPPYGHLLTSNKNSPAFLKIVASKDASRNVSPPTTASIKPPTAASFSQFTGYEAVVVDGEEISPEPTKSLNDERNQDVDLDLNEDTMFWPDSMLLFEDNREFETMRTQLLTTLNENMNEIESISKSYESYCRMVVQAYQMKGVLEAKINVWNTDEFHFVMRTFTNHLNEMEEMALYQRFGTIMLECDKFSEDCFPYPRSIIDVISDRLPVIATKRNDELLTTIKEAIKILEAPLKNVEEFVDQLSFLNKISSDVGALEIEFTTVTKLFHIIQEFNIPLSPEQTAMFKNLPPSFSQMKATITYCEAKKDENIRRFSADLDRLIDDVARKGSDLRIKARDPGLLDPDVDAPSCISEIAEMQEVLQSLQTRIKAYASYEAKFGASISIPTAGTAKYIQEFATDGSGSSGRAQTVAGALAEIERDLALRRLVREAGEEWSLLVDEWLGMPLDRINVEHMQKNVFKFRQTVHMLEKGLPANQLVPKLKEDVDRFADLMPIIVHLKNPALKNRHWQIIEQLLDMTGLKDSGFSFGALVNQKVWTYLIYF